MYEHVYYLLLPNYRHENVAFFQQLIGRMGTPEEMGKVCLFLAADASFCTGLDLMATGGAELGYGPKNPLVKEPGSFF